SHEMDLGQRPQNASRAPRGRGGLIREGLERLARPTLSRSTHERPSISYTAFDATSAIIASPPGSSNPIRCLEDSFPVTREVRRQHRQLGEAALDHFRPAQILLAVGVATTSLTSAR